MKPNKAKKHIQKLLDAFIEGEKAQYRQAPKKTRDVMFSLGEYLGNFADIIELAATKEK